MSENAEAEAQTSDPVGEPPRTESESGDDAGREQRRGQKQYGASVLWRGFVVFVHNFWAFLFFILLYAALQSILTEFVHVERATRIVWIPATIGSALLFTFCANYFTRIALADNDEKIGLTRVLTESTSKWPIFAVWIVISGAIVWLGFVLGFWFGLLFAALLVYVPFLVHDGEYLNPLGKSLVAVWERIGRWALNMIIMAVIIFVLSIGFALNDFFLPTLLAQFIGDVAKGLFAAWFFCAFGVIYRSTDVGNTPTYVAERLKIAPAPAQ